MEIPTLALEYKIARATAKLTHHVLPPLILSINRDGMVNETELRMAMTACATGFCRLHRTDPPPDRTFHSLAQEAFLHQVRF